MTIHNEITLMLCPVSVLCLSHCQGTLTSNIMCLCPKVTKCEDLLLSTHTEIYPTCNFVKTEMLDKLTDQKSILKVSCTK